MVRRRTQSDTAALPAWVTRFSPGAWAGSGNGERWFAWREAVREYVDTAVLDTETWLKVMSNVYGARNRIRANVAEREHAAKKGSPAPPP